MSNNRPPVWKMVKEAIEHLDREVSNSEIRDYVRHHYGPVNESTVNAHMTLQAVNAQSRIHYPENQRPRIADDPRYNVLFRVTRGRYVRYRPDVHGIWEVTKDEKGELRVAQVGTSRKAAGPPASDAGTEPEQRHNKYDWSRLNHLQIGRFAEYFVKMEFTLHGFEVYTTEVDDRGIDFVARRGGPFYEIQVKSVRGLNYIFLPKSKFKLHDNLLAAVVTFLPEKSPDLYLIRATKWEIPDQLLVDHEYEGKKSPPEWGLNISRRNLPLLERFRFDIVVGHL